MTVKAERRSRPYWVLAVVAAYVLLVAGVFALPWLVYPKDTSDAYLAVALIVGVWLLCLGGLMFVPIQVKRRRPITRRTIWLPLTSRASRPTG